MLICKLSVSFLEQLAFKILPNLYKVKKASQATAMRDLIQ